MSWQKAKREAERWIDILQLGKVTDKDLDLTHRGDTLKEPPGAFRAMILDAAKRTLIARGARSVHLPT